MSLQGFSARVPGAAAQRPPGESASASGTWAAPGLGHAGRGLAGHWDSGLTLRTVGFSHSSVTDFLHQIPSLVRF